MKKFHPGTLVRWRQNLVAPNHYYAMFVDKKLSILSKLTIKSDAAFVVVFVKSNKLCLLTQHGLQWSPAEHIERI